MRLAGAIPGGALGDLFCQRAFARRSGKLLGLARPFCRCCEVARFRQRGGECIECLRRLKLARLAEPLRNLESLLAVADGFVRGSREKPGKVVGGIERLRLEAGL